MTDPSSPAAVPVTGGTVESDVAAPPPGEPGPRASSSAGSTGASEPRTKTKVTLDPTHEWRAEQDARRQQIESELLSRFEVRGTAVQAGSRQLGRTEYRFKADQSRVAFTASGLRIATETNSPSVAKAMVDLAQVHHWSALRVTGHEDFRRMIWLEAMTRGVKTVGHEPTAADLEQLEKARDARQANRIEPLREPTSDPAAATTGQGSGKPSGRGNGGRKTVLVAIEAILDAKGIPAAQKEAILAAAATQLHKRPRSAPAPQVRIYDPSAPSRRPAVIAPREVTRSREPAAPTR